MENSLEWLENWNGSPVFPLEMHVPFTSFRKESPVPGYSPGYLCHQLQFWWREHKRMSNGTLSSLDGLFHGSFSKFLVNRKRRLDSNSGWKKYIYRKYNLVPRLSPLIRCRREVWDWIAGEEKAVLGEYLSMTSQLMVESRNDRAENACGLGCRK